MTPCLAISKALFVFLSGRRLEFFQLVLGSKNLNTHTMSQKVIIVMALMLLSAVLNLTAYKFLKDKAEAALKEEMKRQELSSEKLNYFLYGSATEILSDTLLSNIREQHSKDEFLRLSDELLSGVRKVKNNVIELSGGRDLNTGLLIDARSMDKMEYYFYEEKEEYITLHKYLDDKIEEYINCVELLERKSSFDASLEMYKKYVESERLLFKEMSSVQALLLLEAIEAQICVDRYLYIEEEYTSSKAYTN